MDRTRFRLGPRLGQDWFGEWARVVPDDGVESEFDQVAPRFVPSRRFEHERERHLARRRCPTATKQLTGFECRDEVDQVAAHRLARLRAARAKARELRV